MVVYDLDGAVTTNCLVEFIATSFANSTTVTNAITGGSAYNGTAYSASDFGIESASLSPKWTFSGASDIISVSPGTSINNLQKFTIEIHFYVHSMPSTGTVANLIGKASDAAWASGIGWEIYLDEFGRINIKRDQYAWQYRAYSTATSTLLAGHTYFAQITWDCSETATPTQYTSVPVLYLSKDGAASTSESLTNSSAGTVTEWADDHLNSLTIGNFPHLDSAAAVTLYLVRLHDEILSTEDLTTNVTESQWRAFGPPRPVFNYDATLIGGRYNDLTYTMVLSDNKTRLELNAATDSVVWTAVYDSAPIVTHTSDAATDTHPVSILPILTSVVGETIIGTTFVVHLTPNDVVTILEAGSPVTHTAATTTGGDTYYTTPGLLTGSLPVTNLAGRLRGEVIGGHGILEPDLAVDT